MSNAVKIIKLTNNKDRKVTLMFNNELWELFKAACAQTNGKVTQNLEILMIKFIEEKGLL